MKEESVWGYVVIFATLAMAYLYYRFMWWLNWRRSRGILPMYGQAWASPHGRRIFVLGVETRHGALTVLFSDIDPKVRPGNMHAWGISQWRQQVDARGLVLVSNSWMGESS